MAATCRHFETVALALGMSINPENLDLMEKVADGCLIAKFINMIEPDTIDWRAVNYKRMGMKLGALNQYHVIENQNLKIAAAKSIGMCHVLHLRKCVCSFQESASSTCLWRTCATRSRTRSWCWASCGRR